MFDTMVHILNEDLYSSFYILVLFCSVCRSSLNWTKPQVSFSCVVQWAHPRPPEFFWSHRNEPTGLHTHGAGISLQPKWPTMAEERGGLTLLARTSLPMEIISLSYPRGNPGLHSITTPSLYWVSNFSSQTAQHPRYKWERLINFRLQEHDHSRGVSRVYSVQ